SPGPLLSALWSVAVLPIRSQVLPGVLVGWSARHLALATAAGLRPTRLPCSSRNLLWNAQCLHGAGVALGSYRGAHLPSLAHKYALASVGAHQPFHSFVAQPPAVPAQRGVLRGLP